jgi:hypothetical protein
MLAALKLAKADPSAHMLSSATQHEIATAIAAADLAGIRTA